MYELYRVCCAALKCLIVSNLSFLLAIYCSLIGRRNSTRLVLRSSNYFAGNLLYYFAVVVSPPLTNAHFIFCTYIHSSTASFTHFHQDGHGTVDSGHQCLSGYNEVVMLRRMPEEHKQRALYILNDQAKKKKRSKYDGLYGLPHGDGLGAKPDWPTTDAIEECRRMNYCPSVFVLKPGQFVHINKGRLHAFRKLSPTALPPNDCHRQLRLDTIASDNLGSMERLCVSVAWDWMVSSVFFIVCRCISSCSRSPWIVLGWNTNSRWEFLICCLFSRCTLFLF